MTLKFKEIIRFSPRCAECLSKTKRNTNLKKYSIKIFYSSQFKGSLALSTSSDQTTIRTNVLLFVIIRQTAALKAKHVTFQLRGMKKI